MTFPDPPSPDAVVRFRASELCTAAQMWHADPDSNETWLHACVERWQDALVALDEARGEANH